MFVTYFEFTCVTSHDHVNTLALRVGDLNVEDRTPVFDGWGDSLVKSHNP